MIQFEQHKIDIEIGQCQTTVSAIYRKGSGAPILFLHGFGSTKEDYADIIFHPEFNHHPFLAYDAPGCGESLCDPLSAISISMLVDTAIAMLDSFNIDTFHLVGHSMGGLTALLLAYKCPNRVLSFTDIEGNIAPEDCFLSRQIVNYPADNAADFFDEFITRTRHAPDYASALYSASLRHKVRVDAVKPIFTSMVELSDHGELMDKFLNLPCPTMFMYGEQNRHLSYLSYIESQGVALAEIPNCGHFPMYSNPVKMWEAIAKNITR